MLGREASEELYHDVKGNPCRAETEWVHLGRPAPVTARGSLECHVEK